MIDSHEMLKKAEKTIVGHRGKMVHGTKYNCECGWSSTTYYGRGATGQAAYEFKMHKHSCLMRRQGV